MGFQSTSCCALVFFLFVCFLFTTRYLMRVCAPECLSLGVLLRPCSPFTTRSAPVKLDRSRAFLRLEKEKHRPVERQAKIRVRGAFSARHFFFFPLLFFPIAFLFSKHAPSYSPLLCTTQYICIKHEQPRCHVPWSVDRITPTGNSGALNVCTKLFFFKLFAFSFFLCSVPGLHRFFLTIFTPPPFFFLRCFSGRNSGV